MLRRTLSPVRNFIAYLLLVAAPLPVSNVRADSTIDATSKQRGSEFSNAVVAPVPKPYAWQVLTVGAIVILLLRRRNRDSGIGL